MMDTLLRVATTTLNALCQVIPGTICTAVPHASEALSLGSLYVFFQALGLLWCFLVSLCAVICTRIMTAAIESGNAGVGGAACLLDRPLHAVAVCYVYYCVVRVLSLFGQCMWTVAWEIYHDFPTMRHMVTRGVKKKSSPAGPDGTPPVEPSHATFVGGVPPQGSPRTSNRAPSGSPRTRERSKEKAGKEGSVPAVEANGDAQGQQKDAQLQRERELIDEDVMRRRRIQDRRRNLSLVCPLLVLLFLNAVLLSGQVHCEGVLSDVCQEGGFFDPLGRLNRNSRFVIFVSMMQWFQVWTGFFPSWHMALMRAGRSCIERVVQSLVIFLLVPASMLRLLVWFVKPAGIGVVQHMAGLRHFLVDSVLVMGWSLWMLRAVLDMQRPEVLKHSGFSLRALRDTEKWTHMVTMFKFNLFFWQGAHFVRGLVSLGWGHAQNDLIMITMLYPALLCTVWTVTFVGVALSRLDKDPIVTCAVFILGNLGLVGLAWLMCASVDRGGHPLLVMAVWLHFNRQSFRIVRRWARLAYASSQEGDDSTVPKVYRMQSLHFALDPKGHKDLKTSYTFERRVGRIAMRTLLLICAAFLATLSACVFMGALQQRLGLMKSEIVTWRELSDRRGVQTLNTNASVMSLIWANRSFRPDEDDAMFALHDPKDVPHYAVCGHKWHGLQLVDYAFMSLMAYMESERGSSLQELLQTLFPHKQVSIQKANAFNGQRRWLDLNIRSCEPDGKTCRDVTVVAVSGTDPTMIMDYAENLRMWTEPVSLQILSTVFPTVRIWPRDTTALVIGTIHGILKRLAIEDDQWHYREILEHVRHLPADREVVITGHSLGGGIALIIGALTDRLAVAIQPPGVYHSLAKHQVQQAQSDPGQAVHRRSVSVIVEGDWVQNFDGHGGLVQTMGCDQTKKSVAVGCHLLEGAICHLLRHCGDEAGRFSACKHEYTPVSAGVQMAREVLAFLQVSWQGSYIYSQLRSVASVGLTMSAIMVARYGAPSIPRTIFTMS